MADLIKKIKIKKQDGTFTDYIPIGANAANVETSDGESVELKLNKKPYYYNTIADMKADTKLSAGDVAQTLGYYAANDEGEGLYKIVNDNTLTDDGGSIHTLSNGLKAVLIIINNEINIKQFGAKENNSEFDNATIIISSLNFLNELGGGVLHIPTGKFYSSSINYSTGRIRNVTVKGIGHFEATKGTELCYTGNSIFFYFNDLWNFKFEGISFNTTSTTSSFLKVGYGYYRCRIFNCAINNFKYGIDIQKFAYSYIEKTSFSAGDLNDGFHIRLANSPTGLCEFLYITECMFCGRDTHTNFDGIVINSGNNYYINRCDFAGLGNSHAIFLNTESSNIVDVDCTNCNIIRCDKGIEIYAQNASLQSIIIDKLLYYFRGNSHDSEVCISSHRDSDYIANIYIKALSLRQLAAYTGPIFDLQGGSGSCEILTNNTGGYPEVSGVGFDVNYVPTKINQVYTVTMGGTNTYNYIDLLNISPFYRAPKLIVLPRTPMEEVPNINIINTFKDKLRIQVSWNTPPAAGDYKFHVMLVQ